MARLVQRSVWVALLVCTLWAGAVQAQEPPLPRSAILLIDPSRFFAQSVYGRQIAAQEDLLRAENRRIEAELAAEEQALTEARATMEIAAFRAQADAFDQRVQQIRRTQEGKAQQLVQMRQEAQQEFGARAQPVLEDLMQEAGATVVLSTQSVVSHAGAIDITDIALRRLNARLLPPAEQPAPPDSENP